MKDEIRKLIEQARSYADREGIRAEPSVVLLADEVERLDALLNTPEMHDFIKAVPLEAVHQIERWGVEHDAGKEPQDWFWLIGYVAGKALAADIAGNKDKALHHTITVGAVAANWHCRIKGLPAAVLMRPGILPPQVTLPMKPTPPPTELMPRILEIIAEEMHHSETPVDESKTFTELGIDALARESILLSCEQEFFITLRKEDRDDIHTPQGLRVHILTLLDAKRRAS